MYGAWSQLPSQVTDAIRNKCLLFVKPWHYDDSYTYLSPDVKCFREQDLFGRNCTWKLEFELLVLWREDYIAIKKILMIIFYHKLHVNLWENAIAFMMKHIEPFFFHATYNVRMFIIKFVKTKKEEIKRYIG